MLKMYFTVVIEELRRIFRIEDIFEIIVLGSIVYFFFYPIPYLNQQVRDVPIAVMDHDQTTMSKHLLRMINASEALEVVTHVSSVDEGKEVIKRREAYGLLVIPYEFEKNVQQGHKMAVVYFGDSSYVMIYEAAAEGLMTLTSQLNREILINKQIAMGVDPSVAAGNSSPYLPVEVDLFNTQVGYIPFVIPPVYMLIVHQLIWMSITICAVLTRNSRFDYQFSQNKTSSVEKLSLIYMLGKYTAYLFVGYILYWAFIIGSAYYYEFPRFGGIMEVTIFGFCFLTAVIFMAQGMAVIFKHHDAPFLLILPLSMLFFFTSGISWPQYLMPESVQWLSKLLPATATMNGIVRINQMGASLDQVLPELVNLMILSVVYCMIAYYVTYRYIFGLSKMKECPKNEDDS